mmetsp:Transcript_6016/g.26962  ORF Transcript_6016/g.26962 Transcript_6016/m.26962 type:complete len:214 (-) Transcript_6016:4235-4876(-)
MPAELAHRGRRQRRGGETLKRDSPPGRRDAHARVAPGRASRPRHARIPRVTRHPRHPPHRPQELPRTRGMRDVERCRRTRRTQRRVGAHRTTRGVRGRGDRARRRTPRPQSAVRALPRATPGDVPVEGTPDAVRRTPRRGRRRAQTGGRGRRWRGCKGLGGDRAGGLREPTDVRDDRRRPPEAHHVAPHPSRARRARHRGGATATKTLLRGPT